ncbi:hypothetical protein HMSSN036_09900 [Paenibacillus macerans]|nr:hypothetical protein HMSSN036_09900 [Paenibacillus macerans]
MFLDEEKQGGGPLIDIGTHALDLTLWLMDNYEPKASPVPYSTNSETAKTRRMRLALGIPSNLKSRIPRLASLR